MSKVKPPIWANGPGELLRHGIKLAEVDGDSERRIAMILVDNSVELIMKTYFSAPKRVTGLNISRKQRVEIEENFHTLLEGLEQHSSKRIIGIPLEDIEWFHGLRNHLYHQGNGLTVERRNLKVYAELAQQLFEALFDCELDIPQDSDNNLIGEFFTEWISIERTLALAGETEKRPTSSLETAKWLFKSGHISAADLKAFEEAKRIRNQVVHGEADANELLRPTNMKKIMAVSSRIKEVVENLGVLF